GAYLAKKDDPIRNRLFNLFSLNALYRGESSTVKRLRYCGEKRLRFHLESRWNRSVGSLLCERVVIIGAAVIIEELQQRLQQPQMKVHRLFEARQLTRAGRQNAFDDRARHLALARHRRVELSPSPAVATSRHERSCLCFAYDA